LGKVRGCSRKRRHTKRGGEKHDHDGQLSFTFFWFLLNFEFFLSLLYCFN
jgi:hypothetical protein